MVFQLSAYAGCVLVCAGLPLLLQSLAEPVRQLACKHCFHELCIRGWTIVGKKDVCPVCLEKVDMRDLYADKPWETQNLSWWVGQRVPCGGEKACCWSLHGCVGDQAVGVQPRVMPKP
jgi:hypothetical protein